MREQGPTQMNLFRYSSRRFGSDLSKSDFEKTSSNSSLVAKFTTVTSLFPEASIALEGTCSNRFYHCTLPGVTTTSYFTFAYSGFGWDLHSGLAFKTFCFSAAIVVK